MELHDQLYNVMWELLMITSKTRWDGSKGHNLTSASETRLYNIIIIASSHSYLSWKPVQRSTDENYEACSDRLFKWVDNRVRPTDNNNARGETAQKTRA